MPCALGGMSLLGASAQVTLNVDAGNRGAKIGPLHYGIFYEEINNAGDGGIYAELIRNRSFETNGLEFWTTQGGATAKAIGSGLMNDAHLGAMELTVKSAGQGVSNTGYWGIKATEGNTYKFSFWVKSEAAYSGKATFALKTSATASPAAQGEVTFTAGAQWTKVEGTMTATASADDCQFYLTFNNPGTLCLDMVSLFPPTFRNRDNGCRRDLAELLDAMHPAFVRFPGGCYVEGYGTAESNNRFEWKKTIGPVEERPGHYNHNWGYPCTDGMGFHEFLQLTEDLGAEPLFVVNIGLGHFYAVDYTKIDDYIQEALDAIEYCNGDVTTEWGAKRAANGHPEPFNLRLLEIGNENYNYDPNDLRFDHYAERYKAFYDAIKAKYPEITLIGNVESWGTDSPSWRSTYPVEMIDEHYYRTPGWFELQYNKYDSYDRTGPKIYVGEYAVTEGGVADGPLCAALGEAVYMLGMERNSDIVVMNSYAPIFYNEERGGGWLPDMIRFTHAKSYGIPSYHVQQLMATNVGKQNVAFTELNNTKDSKLGHKVGVSTWSTRVAYDNVTITAPDGTLLFADDFEAGIGNWTAGSTWTNQNKTLYQSSSTLQGDFAIINSEFPEAYTFECDAQKVNGAEGFLIVFNYANGQNYCWWNVGGWNNTQHGLQCCIDNVKSDIDLKPGSVAVGKHHVKVEVNGLSVKCWLDGELIHDTALAASRKLYFSTTINDDDNSMYVKVVNTTGDSTPLTINMANASMTDAEVTVLSSASEWDINSLNNPDNIIPAAGAMESVEAGTATYQVPPYSFNIIRLSLSNVVAPSVDESTLTDEQRTAALEALDLIAKKLQWLHEPTELPVSILDGAMVEWYMETPSADVAVASSLYSAMLDVLKPNDTAEKRQAGTLSAKVTMTDGAKGTLEFPVVLAPADEAVAYLLTGSTTAGKMAFALSDKTTFGKKFENLDVEAVATIAMNAPAIGRGCDESSYVATAADTDGLSIVLMSSPDMMHWESTSASLSPMPGVSAVGTPRTMVDGDKVLVYYILTIDGKPALYYSEANAPFKNITLPKLLLADVANAVIWRSNYDAKYHLLGAATDFAGLTHYATESLTEADWQIVAQIKPEGNAAAAMPQAVRRIGEDMMNLYYKPQTGAMKVADTDFMASKAGEAFALEGISGLTFGGVMTVNATEKQMLELWKLVEAELAAAKAAQANGDTTYDAAIALAQTLMDENRTVDDLVVALQTALDAFADAKDAQLAGTDPEGFNDITWMLINPAFSNATPWSGTPFTAISNGVAEHFDHNFDTYQILENMPAGTYRLEAQGFYRYGSRVYSYDAHNEGYERLHAKLYINDSESEFVSLHSEGYSVSNVPDNMSAANTAFNTRNEYTGNSVEHNLSAKGSLRVGVRKMVTIGTDWTCFDNFRLYYKSAKAGVEAVAADSDALLPPVYYNLQGIRVANPTPGIYIVRRGNSVSKELIR